MKNKTEQPEVASGKTKPKSKHLVLDAAAQELFNKAFSITGADTEKQAVLDILTRFCENGGVNELNDYHNPADIAEIERLKELTCDKVNCELNAELTQVNSVLSDKIDELNRVNSELTEQLNDKLNELNELGKKLTARDLEDEQRLAELEDVRQTAARRTDLPAVFGRLNWLLLKWCAARYQKDTGKAISPEQALRMLFEGYLDGKLHVFDKPNHKVIEVFTQRIRQNG